MVTSVQYNRQAIGLSLFFVVLIIIVYTYYPSKEDDITASLEKVAEVKKTDLTKMTAKWDETKAALVGNNTLTVKEGRMKVKDNDVFYRDGSSSEFPKPKGILLFLHGQAFKSQTWLELGTLHFIAKTGYRAIAIDLPGYGETKSFDYGSASSFLLEVKEALGLKDTPVIIISPSMSGTFSIPLLFSNPEAFKGYVPVAPVHTGDHTAKEYGAVQVPTCIVYGEKDQSLGQSSLKDLSNIPNKEVHMLKGAGHAAYLNAPVEFHDILLQFCNKVYT